LILVLIIPSYWFWIKFFGLVIGAGIVEEIFFRGYVYSRSEEVFGDDRYQMVLNKEEGNVKGEIKKQQYMTFEIKYTSIFSSLVFTFYHILANLIP
jgi:membrane protease YdiL (CAAX protease family)